MASIRKRTWESGGRKREAWVVDYFSPDPKTGKIKRHLKTFSTKGEARNWAAETHTEVRQGTHTAASASITVREAAKHWLARVELNGRERSTLAQYGQHVALHINPLLGDTKLSDLTRPGVVKFRDKLLSRASGRGDGKTISRATARKVMTSLKSLLKDAMEAGEVAQNVAAGVKVDMPKRGKRRLEVGVDIPTTAELQAIIAAADGVWRPLIITAALTGLRGSELRGLTWEHVDFAAKVIRVRQRADAYNVIGEPKTATSVRDVPMPDIVANTLTTWREDCPRQGVKTDEDGNVTDPGRLVYVFPNGIGNIETHANILQRGLQPVQIAAGVTVETGEKDEDGGPILRAKYSGLHALRHWFASWLINRKPAGLELPAKTVQVRMGHSGIQITMDLYSHLFPENDDHQAELSDAALAVVG